MEEGVGLIVNELQIKVNEPQCHGKIQGSLSISWNGGGGQGWRENRNRMPPWVHREGAIESSFGARPARQSRLGGVAPSLANTASPACLCNLHVPPV